ncbi:MAG: ribosome biogenesis GTP-binding protein YihA/YsxC [Myxococcota bacterium]
MKILAAELVASAPRVDRLPRVGLPEIAFLGRSNVGKSSLINALARRKKLARTSSTPGKTREIVLFRIETDAGELGFVDLPGYGYAQVSRRERASWRTLVEDYLSKREELRLAVLLQDLRRDFGEDESLLLAWLAEQGVPGRVALTKVDKLKPMKRKERIRALAAEIGEEFGAPIPTSAQGGEGLAALWKIFLDHAFGRREAPAGPD